jgi:hypothetical protein
VRGCFDPTTSLCARGNHAHLDWCSAAFPWADCALLVDGPAGCHTARVIALDGRLCDAGQAGVPSIHPQEMGNVYALGRVPIHNPRWYNGGLIGLSPLLLIPLAYFIIRMGTPATITWLGLWRFLLVPWLAAECLLECLPSLPDLRLARLSIIPLAIIAAGLFLYYRNAIH